MVVAQHPVLALRADEVHGAAPEGLEGRRDDGPREPVRESADDLLERRLVTNDALADLLPERFHGRVGESIERKSQNQIVLRRGERGSPAGETLDSL